MLELLIAAIVHENVDRVASLLRTGADPNAFEDRDRITPLHFIAHKKSTKALRIAQLLMSAGANPLAKNKPDEQTPLDIAKAKSSKAMLDILLGTGKELWH